MAHVLCVSELGAGAGHVAPLMAVARTLRAMDPSVEVTFAVHNPNFARSMFRDDRFRILPCPVNLDGGGSGMSETGSFFEILAMYGFQRADRLSVSLESWDALFDLLKPDVILADHSPTACLAARGRIPVALIGSGFTVPPCDTDNFPALRVGVAAPRGQEHMQKAVNAVLSRRGQPALSALPDIVGTEFRGVFALPETDPYGRLRKDRLLGSYNGMIAPLPPRDDGSVFLYCGMAPQRLGKLVEAAVSLGRPLEAYVGPYESAERQLLRGFGVTVHDKVPNLHGVLERSSVVVSTAGAGLTQAAMMAGRAQLCLPIHMESDMNAQRIVDLNCGLKINMNTELRKLDAALRNVVEVEAFSRNAQEVARRIATYPLPDNPVEHVAEALRKLA